jgi:pimeloyl-ACP methyl ester carboxylesterase
METLSRGDIRLVYEDFGEGPPILCLAPGGLSASRRETWQRVSWNPLKELAGAYRIVAMDQRNTGTSFAPVTAGDGWGSYADDQLALMDHLGIETFAVVGMCIGGFFRILRSLIFAMGLGRAIVVTRTMGAHCFRSGSWRRSGRR